VLAIVGFATVAFFELAEVVEPDETAAFDRELLLLLRSAGDSTDPVGPPWFEEVGRDLTALGGSAVLVLLITAALGYALLRGARTTAVVLLVSTTCGWGASRLLKQLYDRPRPDLVSHEVVVYTQSFPSGHAMQSALTYLTLAAVLARVQPRRRLKAYLLLCALLVTLLVGASRVYLGVHWPTDVLAGWAGGAAWAALSWLAVVVLQERGRYRLGGEAELGPGSRIASPSAGSASSSREP